MPVASSRSNCGSAVSKRKSVAIATICGSSGCSAALAFVAAKYLDLRDGLPLEAFHQQQVARRDAIDQLLQRLLRLTSQLVHVRPAHAGRQQHLPTSRTPVAVGVLAWHVDVEVVMRPLDQRHFEAASGQQRNDAFDQHGLTAARPAGESKDFHVGSWPPAAARPRSELRSNSDFSNARRASPRLNPHGRVPSARCRRMSGTEPGSRAGPGSPLLASRLGC